MAPASTPDRATERRVASLLSSVEEGHAGKKMLLCQRECATKSVLFGHQRCRMADLPQNKVGWRALLKQIAKATRDPQNAEDHLHAAFLKLQQYTDAHEVENPVGFLVRTAMNVSIDARRQDRVRKAQAFQLADHLRLERMSPLQDEVFEAQKRLKAVQAALRELTPKTREVFLMHRVEGLKYREIADRLGITISAVEKHIAKAAQHLLTTFGEQRHHDHR